jgi:hypothetical protein
MKKNIWKLLGIIVLVAVIGLGLAGCADPTGGGGDDDSGSGDKTLSNIRVTTQPTKTTYVVGEAFNTEGVKVTAEYYNYSDATFSSAEVTTFTTDPANGTVLDETGTKTVTVSYTEGDVTKTTTFSVTVDHASVPATISITRLDARSVRTSNANLSFKLELSAGQWKDPYDSQGGNAAHSKAQAILDCIIASGDAVTSDTYNLFTEDGHLQQTAWLNDYTSVYYSGTTLSIGFRSSTNKWFTQNPLTLTLDSAALESLKGITEYVSVLTIADGAGSVTDDNAYRD